MTIYYTLRKVEGRRCTHPYATVCRVDGRMYNNTTPCGQPAAVETEWGSAMCPEHYEKYRQDMANVSVFPPLEVILQTGEVKCAFHGGYVAICPGCHREAELFKVSPATAYCWDGTGEDPNGVPDMCKDCCDDYYAYWRDMWDDYYRSRV